MMFSVCENTNLKEKNDKFGDVQVVHCPIVFRVLLNYSSSNIKVTIWRRTTLGATTGFSSLCLLDS